MKILELGKYYSPHYGGIESLLRSWCEGFVRHGAEVDCVVINDGAACVHEQLQGVRVHRLPSYGMIWSTAVCPSYLWCTRRFGADVWHAHFPNPWADLACLLGPARAPLVITYHSDVIRQARLLGVYQLVLKRLLARATRIIVATPQHLEFSPWLGPYRQKCEVIPFGINFARFQLGADQRAEVARLRAGARGRPIVLSVGRLVGYKGQRFLIEAVRELDLDLWLVGTGPLEPELKSIARDFQVEDRVKFWGAVADEALPFLLQACDLYAMPSVTPNEAFGLTQLEAMACGKPVVSCDLRSGVRFVNQHGITGLVAPPGDPQALAVALRQLLANPELRARMGEAGRLRVQKEFEEGVMIKRYWNCFQNLLAGAG